MFLGSDFGVVEEMGGIQQPEMGREQHFFCSLSYFRLDARCCSVYSPLYESQDKAGACPKLGTALSICASGCSLKC